MFTLGIGPSAALTFAPPPAHQIPARCGWSGSGRHPGSVRGPRPGWGAHRPHHALWYTPLPGPVAQPALQTRRNQRAPHRAIAAEGKRAAATSHPTPPTLRTNRNATGTKRQWNHTSGCPSHQSATGNSTCSGGICTFNVLVFTLCLFGFSTDFNLWWWCCFSFLFLGGGVCFSSGHAYDCGHTESSVFSSSGWWPDETRSRRPPPPPWPRPHPTCPFTSWET